jgi:hypothetical protein
VSQIDDVISEKYRQTLIAQQGRKAEEEFEPEDPTGRAQKRKDNRDEASSSRDSTLDQVMKCIKDMQKDIRLLPEKCAEVMSDVYLNLHGIIHNVCMELMLSMCHCR